MTTGPGAWNLGKPAWDESHDRRRDWRGRKGHAIVRVSHQTARSGHPGRVVAVKGVTATADYPAADAAGKQPSRADRMSVAGVLQ